MQQPPPVLDWMKLPPGFEPGYARAPERLRRMLRFKRWIYLLLSGERHQIGLAWVDLGYATRLFTHVSPHDAAQGEAFSRELLIPGPRRALRSRGADWSLQAGGRSLSLSLRSQAGLGLLSLSAPDWGLSARWQADATPLLWCDAPLPHHTHKVLSLPASWRLRLPGGEIEQAGLLGADLSCGEPPRHIRWHWAFAQGKDAQGPLGFNLAQGFLAAAECGLWQGGRVLPLAEARFDTPAELQTQPWQIAAGEQLSLSFRPRSAYRDATNLGLVSADFVQAYGDFEGLLRLPGEPERQFVLPGVAEFQDTRW